MTGASGVLALVLAETAAGAAGFLFLTPLWGEVRKGFFYLTGGVAIALGLAAVASTGNGAAFADAHAARLASLMGLVFVGLTLAAVVVMGRASVPVGRALGIAALVPATLMLVAYAGATGDGFWLSLVQLLAGAVFTGAVLDGLLLGHWYLTDRKLTRGPINRMAWLLIVAVVVEAVAVLIGAIGANPDAGTSPSISPLLTVAGNATWIAFGMVACTGLIAAFIRAALRGTRPTAVQSATGFFYLAVITAFTAELAAKVRFLH